MFSKENFHVHLEISFWNPSWISPPLEYFKKLLLRHCCESSWWNISPSLWNLSYKITKLEKGCSTKFSMHKIPNVTLLVLSTESCCYFENIGNVDPCKTCKFMPFLCLLAPHGDAVRRSNSKSLNGIDCLVNGGGCVGWGRQNIHELRRENQWMKVWHWFLAKRIFLPFKVPNFIPSGTGDGTAVSNWIWKRDKEILVSGRSLSW